MKKMLLILSLLFLSSNVFAAWDNTKPAQTQTVSAAFQSTLNNVTALDGTSGTAPVNLYATTNVNSGVAGTTTGTIKISGATSGTVTTTVAAAAGTWTFTLPTTAGTNLFLLQTNGSGVTTWVGANTEAAMNSTAGSLNSTSTSYVDVTNATVTVTLDITSHVMVVVSGVLQVSGGAGTLTYGIHDGSNVIVGSALLYKASATTADFETMFSVASVEASVAAGAITRKLRSKVSVNTMILSDVRVCLIAIPAI